MSKEVIIKQITDAIEKLKLELKDGDSILEDFGSCATIVVALIQEIDETQIEMSGQEKKDLAIQILWQLHCRTFNLIWLPDIIERPLFCKFVSIIIDLAVTIWKKNRACELVEKIKKLLGW